jgi:hypothetical protein
LAMERSAQLGELLLRYVLAFKNQVAHTHFQMPSVLSRDVSPDGF